MFLLHKVTKLSRLLAILYNEYDNVIMIVAFS